MICQKPYVQGLQAFPCGQCDPCLFNRSKTWAHRIYLESLMHDFNTFLTLTYDPAFYNSATLVPRHVQLFFKRLRKSLAPAKIRYFAVGEYGDENQRPHYHAAIFGLDWSDPVIVQNVRSAWSDPRSGRSMGHVMLAELNPSTAKYIAGYVTKKYGRQDTKWLNGRHPEFQRMSNRPGIGALAIPELAASLLAVENGRYVNLMEDVPARLHMDGKSYPLGRYLRRKLREELGLPPGAPQAVLDAWKEDMQALLTDAFGPASHANPWSRDRIRDFLVKENKGAVATITAKYNLFKQKRSL